MKRPSVIISRRSLIGSAALAPLYAKASPLPFKATKGVALYPWFHQTRELPSPSILYPHPPFNPMRPVPTARDLAQLKEAGFDHVRLPFDPAPFIAGELYVQNALISQLEAAVKLCIAHGLKVILNLHPNESTHYWKSKRLMAGGNDPNFLKTLALLSTIAKRFSKISPQMLAFEPMNEPKFPPNSREWEEVQKRLHLAVRKEAPLHMIVLSGAEGSLIHGLSPFNPHFIEDSNTWFTFHFYEPFRFTHQGGAWTGAPTKYLGGLSWETAHGLKEEAYEKSARNILKMTHDQNEQKRLFSEVRKAIDQYYTQNFTPQMFKDHFGVVVRWAAQHKIAHSRIYLGEFGVVKTTEKSFAATPESRALWIKQIRELSESLEFGWCFWNYFDVMSLVIDDKNRQLDPSLLKALGLNVTHKHSSHSF